MRWAIAAVMLTGCDFLFELQRIELHDAASDGAPDAAGDAPTRDAGIDARPDAQKCAGYTLTLQSSQSTYRIISSPGNFLTQLDACRADGAHLVALDNGVELDELHAKLPAVASDEYWVGVMQATQPSGQTDPGVGWYVITGALLTDSSMWAGAGPNDSDGTENNVENFGALDLSDQALRDHRTAELHTAVCECDGKPEMLPP